MSQKILILWLGAFGFAIAKHLGENNPDTIFFASEVNKEIFKNISDTRAHPYFFEWTILPENIELITHPASQLVEIDIIISIIPCQFVGEAFSGMKEYLKNWVTVLNLSKWINNQSLRTVSEILQDILWDYPYSYAYLSGGMIAQELVDNKKLWADILTNNTQIGGILKNLFLSKSLDIHLRIWNPKNTELYAALKNIVAMILGYYEGAWAGASTLWYYFSILLTEIQWVILLLKWDKKIDFTDFAFSGDLIATCFGNSRNRFLGNMLGAWKDIDDALHDLREQNKIAEGYETLQWVYKLTQWKQWFDTINTFWEKYCNFSTKF